MNNLDIMKEAEEADAALPEGLQEACLKTGRTPASGDVKMIYYTKVQYLVRLAFLLTTCLSFDLRFFLGVRRGKKGKHNLMVGGD